MDVCLFEKWFKGVRSMAHHRSPRRGENVGNGKRIRCMKIMRVKFVIENDFTLSIQKLY